MKVEKREHYTHIIFLNNDSQYDLKSKIDLIFLDIDNLIIEIQSESINKEELVLSFLNYSTLWKKKNKSFILVASDFKIDHDKEIIFLPTVNEAIEYIYMEELERNV